jgi:hypothetical protein
MLAGGRRHFLEQARLPDAWFTTDEIEVTVTRRCRVEPRDECRELAVTTDQTRTQAARDRNPGRGKTAINRVWISQQTDLIAWRMNRTSLRRQCSSRKIRTENVKKRKRTMQEGKGYASCPRRPSMSASHRLAFKCRRPTDLVHFCFYRMMDARHFEFRPSVRRESRRVPAAPTLAEARSQLPAD